MLTCNTEDLVVIDLVCVFLEVFLTALYLFQSDLQPHPELVLHSGMCLMFVSALGRNLGT